VINSTSTGERGGRNLGEVELGKDGLHERRRRSASIQGSHDGVEDLIADLVAAALVAQQRPKQWNVARTW
jgi:hypothetical protein